MAKSILIITSYYPPESGAAANRIFELATGLQKHHFRVSVVTPMPNYPKGSIFKAYSGKLKQTVLEQNVTVHRLWLYASNSKNKLLRLWAMISYSLSLIWFFIWHKIPDTVIVQSPPLVVAFTCMLCLRRKKRKLILNVSDLWPMAGLELGAFKKNFSYKILEKIERFNYNQADLLLGQSHEIIAHIRGMFPEKKTFLYRNYPNFKPPILLDSSKNANKITLVYAGLLGVAQGIYKLCTSLDYTHIVFHIYGAGAEKESIVQFINSNPQLPIVYHGEVSRNALHQVLGRYDVTIIPLLNRIYGSVPSKIFEYARLGIPMLYFGGGEGETLIKQYELGWVVEAGNYQALNQTIKTLTTAGIDSKNRLIIQQTAQKNFDFNKQLSQLKKLL
ncbi:glycosyltransferase family 4 protein [Bizionia sediminis]|uniref:Glycosyltransferase family 4 protein n=1 Tax=Bizionia sediminis TaxID=1737064 RepID=A0ABW5KUY5_9FLAO